MAQADKEAEQLVENLLKAARRNKQLRKMIAAVLIVVVVTVGCYFAWGLIPRYFTVSVTGGEILFYQHYLATLVREEAQKKGVNLIIQPTSGSFDALKQVSEGKLDMAFIQGGLEKKYPYVVHCATLQPEALHFLVKPEINSVADLKGKVINLGSTEGGAWVIAKRVLDFSGLTADVDYSEWNRTNEQVVGMRREKLPDAIVVISCTPSYLADFFVKERGYKVLEIPFPTSLAFRFGWVAEVTIPDYTYNVVPPVPDREIKTVGVKMQLVANERTDPIVIQRILESLYSPAIENKIKYKLDEGEITAGALFPISDGTTAFLNRNEPLLSMKTWDTLSNSFGLLMTVLSGLLVAKKWVLDEDWDEEEEEEETEKSSEGGSEGKKEVRIERPRLSRSPTRRIRRP